MPTSDADEAQLPATDSAPPARPPSTPVMRMAQGLGWFSIALGLAESLFPLSTGRSIGMPGRTTLLRSAGVREIGAGVGLLSTEDPAPWLWGRVAGDAFDLTALTVQLVNGRSGLRSAFGRTSRRRTALALAVVAGVTALDVACARAATLDRRRPALPDYGDRAGFPDGVNAVHGQAWATGFMQPDDMRVPAALAPYPGK